MRVLDRIAMAAGVLGPIMAVPQAWQIFTQQEAAGVSVLSWTLFALLDIPLFIYGYAHRDFIIMVSYSMWFVINTIVVSGALFYG